MTSNSQTPAIALWQALVAGALATVLYPIQVAVLLLAVPYGDPNVDLAELWRGTKRFFLRVLFGINLQPKPPPAQGSDIPPRQCRNLAGRTGVASTPLRLAGRVRIDGRELAALSALGLIEKGAQVRVIADDGTEVSVVPEDCDVMADGVTPNGEP